MVYLISEMTIRDCSLVNDSVETGYIMQAIGVAQDVRLQEIIGSRLYKRLQSLVVSGDISNPTYLQYKDILDGDIKNFLIYSTMSEIQPMLYGKIRNAGVVQSQDTQTQQLTLSDVHYLTEYYNTKADFYAKKLGAYLCANKAQFPEYTHCDCCGEIGANGGEPTCNLNI